MTRTPVACPHCRRELRTDQRHCKTCAWVVCSVCRAVVDTKTGNHRHKSHDGLHRDQWSCLTHPRPKTGGDAR